MRNRGHRPSCKVTVSRSIMLVLMGCGLSLLTEYGRKQVDEILLLVLASGIHEWGHWVMARVVQVSLAECQLDLLGARLKARGVMSYVQEWWLSAGGPLFNFLSVALVVPLWISTTRGMLMCPEWVVDTIGGFGAVSLGLGGLNLMPIDTFDGGRMLYCFLALFLEERCVQRVSQAVSFLCLSLLWMVSVYVLLRVGRTLSLFVFSFTLLCRGLVAFHET